MRTLFLIIAAALPARAQMSAEFHSVLPRVEASPATIASPTLNPALMAPPSLSLAPPSVAAAAPAAAPAPSPAQRVTELGAQVGMTLDRVGNLSAASAGDSREAGRALESVLTGAAEPAAPSATAEELDFVSGA
ncbi:MAG: hypothetical protein KGL74_11330, partial [Elusimicrobia bacterium]|nr:hypothetical protein [Elusimicrobiota bacterium]